MKTSRPTRRASWMRNMLFNYALQGTNYLVPLVTLPFLVRMLGADAYGAMAFAYVVLMFPVLFLDAGLDSLAARRLSREESSVAQVSLRYAASTWLKIAMAAVVLAVLLIARVLAADPQALDLYLASFLLVAGSVAFPVWLFQGLEVMRYVTVCGMAGRVATALLLFALIRGPEDVVLAASLQAGATLLSGAFALPVILMRLGLSMRHPWRLLAPEMAKLWREARRLSAAEFLERAAANSPVLILGLFAGNAAVGTFAAIEKPARALCSLAGPPLGALYPRFCRLWHSDAPAAAQILGRWAPAAGLGVLMVAICGTALAPLLLELLFGNAWTDQAWLLQALCVWAALAIVSVYLGALCLIAAGQRDHYTTISLGATGIQLVLTIAGALLWQAAGLVLALVFAEAVRAVWLALASRRLLREQHQGVVSCVS